MRFGADIFVHRPRLIRMVTSTNWSLHDLILVDCEFHFSAPFELALIRVTSAPEFHLVIQAGSNGEVYNMAIRGAWPAKPMRFERADRQSAGGNLGGSDGVDVWGTNHWIHDVEVTNRDECVTVKVDSPSLSARTGY